MIAVIKAGKAAGTVAAPPSKSDGHRALIAAALSDGCTVRRPGHNADIEATLRCLRAMGAEVRETEDGYFVGGANVRNMAAVTMDCGESGSTLRFLLPLCMLNQNNKYLRGHGRLPERPLDAYEALCAEQNAHIERDENGVWVRGALTAGKFGIDAGQSSQFVTGLLYTLPLLDGDSTLHIRGTMQSRNYVDMTLQTLRAFGIEVTEQPDGFAIKAGKYHRNEYIVEGDWSSAAFMLALTELGGAVEVTGLNGDSFQGDKTFGECVAALRRGEAVDLADRPDLAPILFAVAAAERGGRFVGTYRLRIKESDRIGAMQTELAKFGITLTAEDDAVTVEQGHLHPPTARLCGHNDHRIVMALAVLCTLTGGEIEGAEAIAKSYPTFFTDLRSLGIEVNEI